MKKSILGVAKESVTVWAASGGIVSLVAAVVAGQIEPITGLIAILFALAIIFLRRAVGEPAGDLAHAVLMQVAKTVDKEAGGDVLISTKKVKSIIEAADPQWEPFQESRN